MILESHKVDKLYDLVNECYDKLDLAQKSSNARQDLLTSIQMIISECNILLDLLDQQESQQASKQ
jgi:hypothetical protein